MKKLILSLAACLIVAVAFSQENKTDSEIRQKAEVRTTALKQQLGLTEEQLPRVKELVTSYEFRKAAGTEKPESLELMMEEQLTGLLTSEQVTIYKEMKANGAVNSTK